MVGRVKEDGEGNIGREEIEMVVGWGVGRRGGGGGSDGSSFGNMGVMG